MSGHTIHLGHEERDSIEIVVLGRQHPGATNWEDGNWLVTPLSVRVAGFRADIPHANLRGDELRQLRRGLEQLYKELSGSASLDSMEDWLNLEFRGDEQGRIVASGSANEYRGASSARLQFTLDLDQTFLPPVIEALEAVEMSYPVIESGR